jgi:type II restriction/modification system DNA methylase subunit YeeA
LWSIQGGEQEKTEERERDYILSVVDWSSRYWKYRNKIRLLVSEEQAKRFLDYEDDYAPENPNSLHYMFVLAHRKVMQYRSSQERAAEADAAVVNLNWKCSLFLEQLTTGFIKKAAALQLLQIPTTPGGAEVATARRISEPAMPDSR